MSDETGSLVIGSIFIITLIALVAYGSNNSGEYSGSKETLGALRPCTDGGTQVITLPSGNWSCSFDKWRKVE